MSHQSLIYLIVTLVLFSGVSRAEIKPDFLMDSDPKFDRLSPVKKSMPEHIRLWIEVLARPEIDYQRMAAESIAFAHQKGIPDLIEAVPALETVLTAESSHPSARYAAARALIVLESRSSSEKLFDVSQKHGSELRQLIEPALAAWDYLPIRSVWKKRLETRETRPQDLILATRGIRRVRETSALATLQQMTLNLIQTPEIRLEAASAAGELAETGLEADADRLVQETRTSSTINRHCALRLLARHTSETTLKLLAERATDPEPSVAAAALKRLNQIDSTLVLPFVELALQNKDVNVRTQAALAYIKLPTKDRIRTLAELLDDHVPDLRRQVCTELSRIAKQPEFEETIQSAAMEILSRDRWRGQEQSALLLGELGHKPSWKRMTELLESSRPEVMIGSAWGLRKIADPESIPAIVDKIRRQTEVRKTNQSAEIDLQVAHLFEACARMLAKEAEPEMLVYVPKNLMNGERSRCCAIWALGWLYAGKPDRSIGRQLIERVNDNSMPPVENLLVKRICIVSLGRMKAVDYAAEFRQKLGKKPSNDTYSLTLQWALTQMTGEEFPDVPPELAGIGGWFLDPIPSKVTSANDDPANLQP